MTPVDPRPIVSRLVPPFSPDGPETLRSVLRDAAPMALRQAWLPAPEPGFTPGTVRTGWRDDRLLVFADLVDADVFTRATAPNQRLWELGDTFEMFLQPPGDASYVELHVAPNNQRLQLRFARPPDAARDGPGAFEAALIRGSRFQSWSWVEPSAATWIVLAEIPSVLVTGRAEGLEGQEWRFSFCRYNYTRGRARPVISSTSPHEEPRFHRPHEWGRLKMQR